MNIDLKNKKKIAKWIIAITTVCIVIFLALNNLPGIGAGISWLISLFMPVIIGIGFAMILNVPMKFFESHFFRKTNNRILQKARKPLSFIVALALILGVIVGVIWLIIPELTQAANVIIDGTNKILSDLRSMDKAELNEYPLGSLILNIDFDAAFESMGNWLKNSSGTIFDTAYGTVSSIIGVIYNTIIGFVFCVYFLFGKERLKIQGRRLVDVWLPVKFGSFLKKALSLFIKNFSRFVSGQTIEALILGILCAIGMLILRLPYVSTVSALVGVLSMIPIIGGFIGAVFGTFMILTVSPVKAIIFLIFLLVLQQLEGNIIYPRVMGKRVNLSGMWILAAVIIGGGIAGPIGIFLGVPTVSTAYVLIKDATAKREAKLSKNSDEATSAE